MSNLPQRLLILTILTGAVPGGTRLAAAQDRTTQLPVTSGDDAKDEVPTEPNWIVTLSSGVLGRDAEQAQPFLVGGVSRRIGRGYARISATAFRSVLRQFDAILPSTFTVASLGGGATFGQWFVDGYGSVGWQRYGRVTTDLGTRPSSVGSGSGVYGGSLSGGRFINLTPRLYLTPSAAIQYSANRTLRTAFGPLGPLDYETHEQAWTGSSTVRLDRFFGAANRHIAGFSLSGVRTSNGAVVSAGSAFPGGNAPATNSADRWLVAGVSTSLQIGKRLWVDGGATQTMVAKAGDYRTVVIGIRKGF